MIFKNRYVGGIVFQLDHWSHGQSASHLEGTLEIALVARNHIRHELEHYAWWRCYVIYCKCSWLLDFFCCYFKVLIITTMHIWGKFLFVCFILFFLLFLWDLHGIWFFKNSMWNVYLWCHFPFLLCTICSYWYFRSACLLLFFFIAIRLHCGLHLKHYWTRFAKPKKSVFG